MIVLDTTVLVYATGADHPLRTPCRNLVSAVAGGGVEATTTVEAIQEFVHVRARRRTRADAAELGAAYADLLAPLLPVGRGELQAGLRLFQAHRSLGAFDAVLAAAAIAGGAELLVSADRAFAAVREVRAVAPGAPEVERLLRG